MKKIDSKLDSPTWTDLESKMTQPVNTIYKDEMQSSRPGSCHTLRYLSNCPYSFSASGPSKMASFALTSEIWALAMKKPYTQAKLSHVLFLSTALNIHKEIDYVISWFMKQPSGQIKTFFFKYKNSIFHVYLCSEK